MKINFLKSFAPRKKLLKSILHCVEINKNNIKLNGLPGMLKIK